jgi:hypothetical protein
MYDNDDVMGYYVYTLLSRVFVWEITVGGTLSTTEMSSSFYQA